MRATALAAALLLVVSAAGAAVGAPAASQSGSAYNGAHVSFDVSNAAVVDYTVDGTTIVENLTVQSTQNARSGGGVGAGAGVDAVTNFRASGLSLGAEARTSVTVSADSGAELVAHDNDRGIMVVSAGGQGQYVRANLSSGSSAERKSDRRVVVTTESGEQCTFIVVGDGTVTVNRAGNVTAELGNNGRLVLRQYDGERSGDDKQQEALIANGTAAAEVYLDRAADSGQGYAADVVSYGQDTTVDVTTQSKNRLEMTVERSQSQGKVVLATLSKEAFDSAEDVQVTVDGQAAASASSYGEVASAAKGGDGSAFLVRQSSSADAAADVAVGIDHFSSREVAISGGGDGQQSPGATDSSGPGFGALAALAALGAALVALRRR